MVLKLRSLQRIASLYALVAEARAYDLEVATMRVHVTQMEIVRRESFIAEAFDAGRVALQVANSLEWQAAEVAALVAQRDMTALAERRLVEVSRRDIARAEYVQGKQRSEQVNQIVSEMRRHTAKAEVRSEQAISDDRFLARKHWLALQRR